MVWPMRWARRVVLAWAVGVAAAPARAAEPEATAPPATYALSWVRAQGAEDCPTGRALAAEVERRLGRRVFDAAAERSFEVEVTRIGARYHSDVFVRDAAGRALGHRALESDEPGCAALFGATALAIALVIDPDVAQRESGVSQGVAAFEALPPAAPPPLVVAPPVVAPPPKTDPTPPVSAAPPPMTAVTMSLRGLLLAGTIPSLAPGLGLAVTARPTSRWGYALSGSYVAPRTAREGEGVFEIGLTRATAALTFDAARSDAVRLVLSAGPSLGAYHLAVLEPVPVTDPGDLLFAALEFGTSLQVSVSKGIFFELGGQALVPLKRQQFLARGQTEPVWSQPWLSGGGLLGVGTRFP
jgi:hypothetical protein